MNSSTNYHAGYSAEEIVADKYKRSGFSLLARRYKCKEGEIDLVAGYQRKLYFVEVKKSKSFEKAALRITPRQIYRIRNSALQYLADYNLPLETEIRFDAALVNEQGRIKVIANAFC